MTWTQMVEQAHRMARISSKATMGMDLARGGSDATVVMYRGIPVRLELPDPSRHLNRHKVNVFLKTEDFSDSYFYVVTADEARPPETALLKPEDFPDEAGTSVWKSIWNSECDRPKPDEACPSETETLPIPAVERSRLGRYIMTVEDWRKANMGIPNNIGVAHANEPMISAEVIDRQREASQAMTKTFVTLSGAEIVRKASEMLAGHNPPDPPDPKPIDPRSAILAAALGASNTPDVWGR